MATGFGLRFCRTLHGDAPVSQRYYIPSTNSTALAIGDVVELVNTTGVMDPKSEVAQIVPFVSGHIPLGVVKGFGVDGSVPLSGNYRAASTNRYVDVIVDPDAVYEAQEDAVGGSVTAALVGAMSNVNLIVTTPDTSAYYRSGTMVDSSTTTASAADCKIVGVPANGGANYAALSGGAILEVMLLGTAMRATDSQS